MLAHEYKTMRSLEDSYWWYCVLRKMTCLELVKYAGKRQALQILDAGCGTGGTLEVMRKEFPLAKLTGFDVSKLALKHVHEREFRNVFNGSVDRIPLADSSQNLIVSLDVLYHEEVNQERAMQQFFRVLAPTGRLIMNLPAFECLRGQHDFAVKNVRRYTPCDVRALHERNGFVIETIFCWNAWLFIPLLFWRKLSAKLAGPSPDFAKSDLVHPPTALNYLLSLVGSWEAAICRRFRSPLGTSVFSVAKVSKST